MMKILIDLDEPTASRLKAAVPARSRRRSEFIRAAIRKALWELEERATRRAYAAQPDAYPDVFDPTEWEAEPPRRRR